VETRRIQRDITKISQTYHEGTNKIARKFEPDGNKINIEVVGEKGTALEGRIVAFSLTFGSDKSTGPVVHLKKYISSMVVDKANNCVKVPDFIPPKWEAGKIVSTYPPVFWITSVLSSLVSMRLDCAVNEDLKKMAISNAAGYQAQLTNSAEKA
jgi:ubiquitin-protein ligase